MFKKALLSSLVSVFLTLSLLTVATAFGAPTENPPSGLTSPTFGGLTVNGTSKLQTIQNGEAAGLDTNKVNINDDLNVSGPLNVGLLGNSYVPGTINWGNVVAGLLGTPSTVLTTLTNTGKVSINDDILVVGDYFTLGGDFFSKSALGAGPLKFDGTSTVFKNTTMPFPYNDVTIHGDLKFLDPSPTDSINIGSVSGVSSVSSLGSKSIRISSNKAGSAGAQINGYAYMDLISSSSIPSISVVAPKIYIGDSVYNSAVTNYGTLDVQGHLKATSIGAYRIKPGGVYLELAPDAFSTQKVACSTGEVIISCGVDAWSDPGVWRAASVSTGRTTIDFTDQSCTVAAHNNYTQTRWWNAYAVCFNPAS